jgi:hypothetical protein
MSARPNTRHHHMLDLSDRAWANACDEDIATLEVYAANCGLPGAVNTNPLPATLPGTTSCWLETLLASRRPGSP